MSQMSKVRKSKVVVLGDAEVGKSSLITRFCYDAPPGESYTSTIGIDFMAKAVQVQGQTMRLQLWDTAGSERYRGLASSYLQDAEAVVLVYDISKRASFINTREWSELVLEKCGKIPLLVLVGNKMDLAENRIVSDQEGMQLAKEIGAKFFLETSALEDCNVKTLFEQLAHTLMQTQVPTLPFTMGKTEDLMDLPVVQIGVPRNVDNGPDNGPKRCRCWPF